MSENTSASTPTTTDVGANAPANVTPYADDDGVVYDQAFYERLVNTPYVDLTANERYWFARWVRWRILLEHNRDLLDKIYRRHSELILRSAASEMNGSPFIALLDHSRWNDLAFCCTEQPDPQLAILQDQLEPFRNVVRPRDRFPVCLIARGIEIYRIDTEHRAFLRVGMVLE